MHSLETVRFVGYYLDSSEAQRRIWRANVDCLQGALVPTGSYEMIQQFVYEAWYHRLANGT
eukprot:scaffold4104_cov119-Skeletonema_menzelii.AAC.1